MNRGREGRRKQPSQVALQQLTAVPFTDEPISEYLPGFEAEINGQRTVAHVDTGGTFLHMGTHRAEEFGISLSRGGKGYHGTERVETHHGIAPSFRLGEAFLENVPVVALPSFKGGEDFIVFGTNILQLFLATLDYPDRRLVLSPRNDPDIRRQHLATLPENRVEIPFNIWGGHYMFARGGVGEHRDLNFFIDSGLVFLHPDGEGGLQQAAFWSSRGNYETWGIDPDAVHKEVFASPLPLSLGPLEQDGHLFLARDKVPYGRFGRTQIHGLLSHAFLKRYAWTLDFGKHMYTFSV